MAKLRSRRPSHSAVVAYVALFVALGGSSYAALRVGTKQIVDNSVRSRDIRNGEVRGADVRDSSLLAEDFKPGQLPAGPRGESGPRGATGARGSDAASMVNARVQLPAVSAGVQDGRYGAVVGISTATLDAGPVSMVTPPVVTVARDLFVKILDAPGATNRREVSLGVGANAGGGTALDCVIPETIKVCSDTTHTVAIGGGSEIRLYFAARAQATDIPATTALVSWRATTP